MNSWKMVMWKKRRLPTRIYAFIEVWILWYFISISTLYGEGFHIYIYSYFIYINLISLASNNKTFKATLTVRLLFLHYMDYKISLKTLCVMSHRNEERKASGIVNIINLEAFWIVKVLLQKSVVNLDLPWIYKLSIQLPNEGR